MGFGELKQKTQDTGHYFKWRVSGGKLRKPYLVVLLLYHIFIYASQLKQNAPVLEALAHSLVDWFIRNGVPVLYSGSFACSRWLIIL